MAGSGSYSSLDDFLIERQLSLGSGGPVVLARDRRNPSNRVVIKTCRLRKRRDAVVDPLNEYEILSSLSPHPNVVHFQTSFIDEERQARLLVFKYANAGDFRDYLDDRSSHNNYFSEAGLWTLFLQICKGLDHIHGEGVIHRDIKPANVLVSCAVVSDGSYKAAARAEYQSAPAGADAYKNLTLHVSDFDVAVRMSSVRGGSFTDMVGSRAYFAPEILREEGYSTPADIWAAGVLLFEMAFFRPPFTGANRVALYDNICDGFDSSMLTIDEASRYSPFLINVLRRVLATDPTERPSAADLVKHIEKHSRRTLEEREVSEGSGGGQGRKYGRGYRHSDGGGGRSRRLSSELVPQKSVAWADSSGVAGALSPPSQHSSPYYPTQSTYTTATAASTSPPVNTYNSNNSFGGGRRDGDRSRGRGDFEAPSPVSRQQYSSNNNNSNNNNSSSGGHVGGLSGLSPIGNSNNVRGGGGGGGMPTQASPGYGGYAGGGEGGSSFFADLSVEELSSPRDAFGGGAPLSTPPRSSQTPSLTGVSSLRSSPSTERAGVVSGWNAHSSRKVVLPGGPTDHVSHLFDPPSPRSSVSTNTTTNESGPVDERWEYHRHRMTKKTKPQRRQQQHVVDPYSAPAHLLPPAGVPSSPTMELYHTDSEDESGQQVSHSSRSYARTRQFDGAGAPLYSGNVRRVSVHHRTGSELQGHNRSSGNHNNNNNNNNNTSDWEGRGGGRGDGDDADLPPAGCRPGWDLPGFGPETALARYEHLLSSSASGSRGGLSSPSSR